jgi:hypothetical protein
MRCTNAKLLSFSRNASATARKTGVDK